MEKTSIIDERMSEMRTVRDLIALWPTHRSLAEDVGAPLSRVQKWPQAGAVPAKYHYRLHKAAVRRGFAVTAEDIARLHDVSDTTTSTSPQPTE